MLKLFRFSLKGKALEWFRNLIENGIKTWGECKATFLTRYIPQEELMKSRNQITSFAKMIGETFLQAWERFSKLLRFVPNHGNEDNMVYIIFYDCLNAESKDKLDACSNGSFMTKTIQEGNIS